MIKEKLAIWSGLLVVYMAFTSLFCPVVFLR
jgi:hypothetical protein